MGREYNRCLLVKKYSPWLAFTNMSFTDGLRMVSDEFYFAQVLRARVARGCG